MADARGSREFRGAGLLCDGLRRIHEETGERQAKCCADAGEQRRRGVAAGVGDTLGTAHGIGLAYAEFGKAKHPTRCGAVSGRGIDDARATPRQGVDHGHRVAGGIVDREKPLHPSNVMLFNPTTQKADRVGFRRLADGRKVRFFKSNGEVLDT
mgnify:CR=1 FL=1